MISDSDAMPRVVLATPYYGSVSMGLLGTIRSAVKDRSAIQVVMEAQGTSSILPQCFNQLLAIALDARDEGKATHLAMCHADIIADPGWLNVLWSEMFATGADLVSAVVPIKGPSGRTSTAIGDESDPWAVKRCIFANDRDRYPPTFGAQSVCSEGEVLLVNTGLFLADLRAPFWDDFAFQFHTRIRKSGSQRIAECRSEDWELSHHMHKHKARYYATWKPRLRHEGQNKWPNYPE